MTTQSNYELAIFNEYFSGMPFADEREKMVFLSYLKAFSILLFDPSVKSIVEIGGGQSTAIFSLMSETTGCEVNVIDMNPDAIKNKVKDDVLCKKIAKNVNFHKGVSITGKELGDYYSPKISHVGGIPLNKAIQSAKEFIDISMDNRKENRVLEALNIPSLDSSLLEGAIIESGGFSQALLDVFRTKDDEFDYVSVGNSDKGLLADLIEDKAADVVFLDSGEFSSLPEWEIVSNKLRPGGYVILHDIIFPKSFKNWLVCGSIEANDDWNTIYTDMTTPQGIMVAKKEK